MSTIFTVPSVEKHVSQSTSASDNTEAASFKFIAEPKLYKTKMCRNFLRDGYCIYETKCMFAHGANDLRAVEENVQLGLSTEDDVKRFQTKNIIEFKKKSRKEAPPSFQEAVKQAMENDKPRYTRSAATPPATPPTLPVTPQVQSEDPMTPPVKCLITNPAMFNSSTSNSARSSPVPFGASFGASFGSIPMSYEIKPVTYSTFDGSFQHAPAFANLIQYPYAATTAVQHDPFNHSLTSNGSCSCSSCYCAQHAAYVQPTSHYMQAPLHYSTSAV